MIPYTLGLTVMPYVVEYPEPLIGHLVVCSEVANPGPCLALLPRWFFDVRSRKCLPFSFGGCGGNRNNFLSKEHCRKVCGELMSPPARPTDGVDIYFENPGDENEHAHFVRAKMDLEERRMNRINEVMREWAAADHRAKNAPNTDRIALNKHFQQVLGTLEEQVANERQRLMETHLSRVLALLNDDRRMALENYLTALQADPPQPDHVLRALIHYIRAEEKDRRHSVRHYQHILTVDPEQAQQLKFQVVTHLRVIEERMNQSLALLFKIPELARELRDDV
ncbi:amyloid-beta precursor protein-like, partial [Heterodontus francisci]|uniref:amyloid-beta precursor protein-like n=1 Tax=Heterodontus francisci TaxID=7792 RepID=UPI00355BEFC7